VAYAYEVHAATHNTNVEAVFLKLDLEKAFDFVN